jgi:hypothetical protein
MNSQAANTSPAGLLYLVMSYHSSLAVSPGMLGEHTARPRYTLSSYGKVMQTYFIPSIQAVYVTTTEFLFRYTVINLFTSIGHFTAQRNIRKPKVYINA